MRWRGLLTSLVVGFILTTTFAQDEDVTVTAFNLSNTQSIHIASLDDDFDFFRELIAGQYEEDDFEREHALIHWCGDVWHVLADAFNFHIPAAPDDGYLRRWRTISDQLDYDVVLTLSYTLRDAAELLPGNNVQVCLVPAVPPTQKYTETEIYGASYDGGMILAIGTLRDGWETTLANVVAHEYHHAARAEDAEDYLSDRTLLDRLIAEGKASVFAQMVVPEYDNPIYTGLTSEEEQAVWREMQAQLQSEDSTLHDYYMFGDNGMIPRNAGYTIGYHLMQTFIANNPTMPVEEWILLPSSAIYAGSQYQP